MFPATFNSAVRPCLLCLAAWASVLPLSLARAASNAAPAGTIAYVRGWRQIRLIRPDGSGDRELWTQPPSESRYGGLRELAFRPDGKELAFSSSHEMAFSFYEADLYGIGIDGKGLHRLTNAPSPGQLDGYPTCNV